MENIPLLLLKIKMGNLNQSNMFWYSSKKFGLPNNHKVLIKISIPVFYQC